MTSEPTRLVIVTAEPDWAALADAAPEWEPPVDPYPDLTLLGMRREAADLQELEDIYWDPDETDARRLVVAGHLADFLASRPASANATTAAETWRKRATYPEKIPAQPWSRADLVGALTGTRPVPEIMPKTDGNGLFYRGKTHSVSGESESGKSWLCVAACLTETRAGGRALYIDFEDDEITYAHRAVDLGATTAELQAMQYFRADEAWEEAPRKLLRRAKPTLVILDGVTEGMTLLGMDAMTNEGAALWMPWVRDWTRAGAAVVVVDHVPKDRQTRGRFAIGGQHKLSGLNGAAYQVEPLNALRPGEVAAVVVRVAKDRHGGVRAHAAPDMRDDRTQYVGTFRFNLEGKAFEIVPPAAPKAVEPVEALETPEAKYIRNVISFLLERKDATASYSKLRDEVPGVAPRDKARILGELWEKGVLERVESGRYTLYRLVESRIEDVS